MSRHPSRNNHPSLEKDLAEAKERAAAAKRVRDEAIERLLREGLPTTAICARVGCGRTAVSGVRLRLAKEGA